MAKVGQKGTRKSSHSARELAGWALAGLEREIATTRERLHGLTATVARLRGRVGGKTAGASGTGGGGGRRRGKMTAEGRKRISDMMKKRWAEAKRKKQNRLT
jgi:hypothetical protein